MHRRAFIQSFGTAALAQPLRSAQPALRLGLDTYTLRAYNWSAIQLLDYAASQRLDTIQFSDLVDYGGSDAANLARIREHAERLGISIDSGLGCICPTSSGYQKDAGDPVRYAVEGLRAARAVGSNGMRVYIGGSAERKGPLERHLESTLQVLRAVRPQALDLGVRIAIENHGDVQSSELRELIETAGKDYVGCCLDSGNATAVLEDPCAALETLAPYVVTSHIRDTLLYEDPRGAVTQWVALGDGTVDFQRFFEIYRQRCPQAGVQLEILTGGAARVVPFLEPGFWQAYPRMKAADFAPYLALVRKGRPSVTPMLVAPGGKRPPEYEAALKLQQKLSLERSYEYARTVLKLGVRGRGAA